MMKNPLSPAHGLTLLALSIALTGCPSLLDTEILKEQPSQPQPSASAPAEEQKDEDDKQANFTIKALGPVRAKVQGAIDVENGPFTVELNVSNGSLYGVGILGILVRDTDPVPEGVNPYAYGIHHQDEAGDFWPPSGEKPITHRFYYLNTATNLDKVTFSVGETGSSAVRGSEYSVAVDFPATSERQITVGTLGGNLRILPSDYMGGKLTFLEARTITHYGGTRSATVSMDVAVEELDGTPSTGLTAANFQLSGGGRITLQVTEKESAPGVYRVVAALDGLEGALPTPQRRMLTVTHATVTHTHAQPTPPAVEEFPR
jgi:hypothetical protein